MATKATDKKAPAEELTAEQAEQKAAEERRKRMESSEIMKSGDPSKKPVMDAIVKNIS